jgi:DUF4097 and DUF4098 domain-containing protein YvlB
MRSIIVMAMFVASLTAAAAGDFEEQRELKIDAAGISEVEIDAGAGNLEVTGVAGLDEVKVTATIQVPDHDGDAAREIIESELILTLDKQGDRAVLKAGFEEKFWDSGDSPRIHLVVYIPAQVNLSIDDGSGSIEVTSVSGDVMVEDGSGGITLTNVGGQIDIDDGSGSISADSIGGDLLIVDGSGSIDVNGVAGSVTIDDGSGSIDVRDVEKDLIIVDDGSGDLDYSGIKGSVETDS